jgi:type 1 glutamine amidotransferase
MNPEAMKNLNFTFVILITFLSSCTQMNKKDLTGLLITGNDHPAHIWQETSPAVKNILDEDGVSVVITENPEDLAGINDADYQFIILNYANWEDPNGLSEEAKEEFVKFLNDGGGLIVLHFSNGAFHYSLPGAEESDWPEYRNIVRRVWDHDSTSTHDPYGEFKVEIASSDHFIISGLESFDTKDELYFNQFGDMDLEPLVTARSKVSGIDEPLAFAYTYGKARIFQSLLGHSKESYEPEEYQEMLRRAVQWVCGKDK